MKENGYERGEVPQNFSSHLKRFFDDSPEETEDAIQSTQEENPDISKAELFRRLSNGKGRGKSHVSQFTQPQYDGQLKRS